MISTRSQGLDRERGMKYETGVRAGGPFCSPNAKDGWKDAELPFFLSMTVGTVGKTEGEHDSSREGRRSSVPCSLIPGGPRATDRADRRRVGFFFSPRRAEMWGLRALRRQRRGGSQNPAQKTAWNLPLRKTFLKPLVPSGSSGPRNGLLASRIESGLPCAGTVACIQPVTSPHPAKAPGCPVLGRRSCHREACHRFGSRETREEEHQPRVRCTIRGRTGGTGQVGTRAGASGSPEVDAVSDGVSLKPAPELHLDLNVH